MLNDFKLRYEFIIRLHSLIVEDIELIDALDLISDINKNKISKAKIMLEKGYTISKAFSIISSNSEFLSYFESVEKTGDLKNILILLKNKYEFKKEFKDKLISVSIYPFIIIITSIFIVYILLIYFVPKFTNIYIDSNIKLPNITRFIIYISDNLFKITIFFLFFIIIIFSITIFLIKKNKLFFDKLILNIKFIKLIQITKLVKNISILLDSNIPLIEALEIVKPNNLYLANKIKITIYKIKRGESIYFSFKKSYIFDDIILTYLKIAEKTGNLKKSFLYMSNIYENETKNRINIFLKLFEPISIMIIAIFIGFITIAIMIPLLDISSTSFSN